MVDEDGEKLAQEREEHRAVAELTRKEQDYVQALKEVSDWLAKTTGDLKLFGWSVIVKNTFSTPNVSRGKKSVQKKITFL